MLWTMNILITHANIRVHIINHRLRNADARHIQLSIYVISLLFVYLRYSLKFTYCQQHHWFNFESKMSIQLCKKLHHKASINTSIYFFFLFSFLIDLKVKQLLIFCANSTKLWHILCAYVMDHIKYTSMNKTKVIELI